jgi:hypothetical protein
MKAQKGLRIATWIGSVGAFLFWSCGSCLFIMAFVPSPGSGMDAQLLLATSIGFGMTAFAGFWLIYWIVRIWAKRTTLLQHGEQADGE